MDLIFDAPWWLYVVPAAIGLAMAYFGLRKGDGTLRNVGLIALVVGVAILVVSMVVETDTEVVARQSKELVASVEQRDWARLSSLMEEGAAVTMANIGDIYTSRDQIVQACRSRTEDSNVTALAVTALEAKKDGASLISAAIQIYVTAGDRPLPTEWRLDWARGADGRWLIREITAVQIGNVRASDMRSFFPRAR